MSDRTFLVVAGVCVVVAARLLASAALLDAPALGVAGLAPLVILALARWRILSPETGERRRGAMPSAAVFQGGALLIAAGASFANGKHGPSAVLLLGGLAACAWGWRSKRQAVD